jgi:hypothetical protein
MFASLHILKKLNRLPLEPLTIVYTCIAREHGHKSKNRNGYFES